MRWPWQRDHPRETSPPAPADGSVQRAAAPSPMGWAFLPPLQRSIAAPELITGPSQFPHTLPAWRDPSFSHHDLGHVVSPAAPSGVIDGDGTGAPVQRAGHPDLPLLLTPPPRTPVVHRSAVEAPAATPAPAPQRSYTRTSTEHLPVLQLAAVEPATAPEPEPTPEPVADVAPEATPDEGHGDAAEQEAAVPGLEARSARTSTSGGLDPRSARTSTSGDGVAPTLGASDGSTPAIQRSADLASPAAPPSPAPRRRYGLGAPLASVPPSSTPVQRQVESSAPSAPVNPAAGSVAPPTLHAPPATSAPPTASTSVGPGTLPPAPGPAVQRSTDTPAPTPALDAVPEPTTRPTPPEDAATTLPPPSAPDAVSVPDRPTLQRTTALTTLAPADAPAATPVQRAPASAGLPVVPVVPPHPGHRHEPQPVVVAPTDDEAPVQRAADPAVEPAVEPGDSSAEPTDVVAAEEPQPPATPDLALVVPTSGAGAEPAGTVADDAPSSMPDAAPDGASSVDVPPASMTTLSGAAPLQRSVETTEPPTTQPLLGGPRPTLALLTPSSTAPTPVGAVGSGSPGAATLTVSRSAAAAPVVTGRTVHSPARSSSAPTVGTTSGPFGGPVAPTVSRAIGLPSMPSVPSAPSLSSMPTLPAAPTMPAFPVLPAALPTDLPSIPSVPSMPAVPSVPGTPTASGSSFPTPGIPALPLAPTGAPSVEQAPAAEAPVTPAEPVLDPRSSGGATEVPIGGGSGSAPGAAAGSAAEHAGGAAAAGAAGHGGSSGASGSPDDMEALAQKLLTPMLRRIKAELLLDRERRGLRTDTW